MDTIFLYNQRNESFPTEVIRYFAIEGKKYFIFTLNEKDSNGYVQLYATRIEEENGKLVMKNIIDEAEWGNFKDSIQKIVVNNRNNVMNTTDLSYDCLNNMIVTDFRIFKLKENVAKELGMNKNIINNSNKSEPQSLEAASARSNNLTIEEILKQVSESAKTAKEVKKDTTEDYKNNDSKYNYKTVDVPMESIVETKENVDYKRKYEELLIDIRKLETENIKLINQLLESKAKIETIKDLIDA